MVRYYADTEVGAKLTLDGEQAKKTMKDFKQEIRQAKEDLLNMSATFGETSKEALAAAQKVAKLQDAIKDANETAQLFDPGNKFQVVGNAVRGLVGGFTALQGALALAGVEGEQVQKTLLRVQSAMALMEGLNTVADMAKDWQRLGGIIAQTTVFQYANNAATTAATAIQKLFGASVIGTGRAFTILKGAIMATGIGLLIVGIGALVSKLGDWISGTDKQKEAQERLNMALERYNELVESELNSIDYVVKSRKLRAELAGKSEKELSQIEEQGNKERLDALKKNMERIREEKKNAADLSVEDNEKLNKADLDAQRKYWDEVRRQELEGLQKQLDARKKSRPTSSGTKKKDELTPLEQFIADSKLMMEREQEEFRLREEEKKKHNDNIAALDESRFMKSTALQEAQTQIEKNNAEARARYYQLEAEAKINAAQNTGDALGILSDLVGKETAAGKVLAIAQATINTYLAASEALKGNYGVGPFAQVARIAAVASTIALGLKQVKEIVKVKVPKGGGGGNVPSAAATAPAPLTPQATVTNTLLNQGQLNQIGNAAARAFVLESDVTNNQERIRRLNRAARLG